MRKLFFIVFLIPTVIYAQINEYGAPFITNFSPKTYKANNLNWVSIKTINGLMLFGNAETGKILIYDNNNNTWQSISNNNHSDVRSFATDSTGLVYVGSIGEFGYIGPDINGQLHYHNLSNQIDTSYNFSELNIWKVFNTDSEVIFYSVKYLFRYQKKTKSFKVTKLPKNSFLGFMVNHKLFIGNYDKGLMVLSNDSVKLIPGGKFFAKNDIFGILPWSNHQLFVYVSGMGFYIYDQKTGNVQPFEQTDLQKATNSFFKTKQVYYTTIIYDNIIGIATIGDGVFFMTRNGKIISHLDNDITHLIPDNIVTSIYAEQEGKYKVVWLTTNNGISKIEFDLPIFNLFNQFGLTDIPVRIAQFNNDFYFSTFSGLFKLSYETNYPHFVPISEFENKTIYSILPIEINNKKKLIIGTTVGIYEISDDGKIDYINKTENIIPNQIVFNKNYPNSLFIGSERGINKLNLINNKWKIDTTFSNDFTSFISWLTFDNNNNLWLATLNNGLVKIDLETHQKSVYDLKKGLPSVNSPILYSFDNKIFVSGSFGLYVYNPQLDSFQPSTFLGVNFASTPINNIYQMDSNTYLFVSNNRIHKVIVKPDTVYTDDRIFKRLPEMNVKDIYTDDGNKIWIASSEGVFVILPESNFIKVFVPNIKISNQSFQVHLSRVTDTKNDSSFFFGNFPKISIENGDTIFILSNSQPDFMNPVFPYKNNDINFRFSAPFFVGENNITYSYKLEGFDEKWSKWSNETRAVYTNLKEGKYTFEVKARNVFNDESLITNFSFEILPPWYRTIWAYIIYFIVIISGLYFIVKFYTRKLERDKKRLEKIVQERTAEVVKQKDEIEGQKAIIEEKNKDITDSIRYAEQIQVAVLPKPIEDLSKYLEYFIYFQPKDIVSGDFYFIKFIPRANLFIAAAVDCTGHGVPGAFMSLLGVTFLNEIINKAEVNHTDQVLNHLRNNVIKALNQEGKDEQKKDGMDMSLITFNIEEKTIEFSGANNPLYLFRENSKPPLNSEKKFVEDENVTMYEFKADRMPIGLHDRANIPFKRQEIKGEPGDMMYIFSDGYADQFGGKDIKKYTYKRFKQFLLSIHKKSMEEQEQLIRQEIINWRNQREVEEVQIDDHIIIGIRLL